MRLSALLRDTEADILALQELRDPQVLTQVAQDLSEKTSRHYQVAVSGLRGRRAAPGLLRCGCGATRRAARVSELRTDQGKKLLARDRAGLLGVFFGAGGACGGCRHLLTVHFPAGGDIPQIEKRQQLAMGSGGADPGGAAGQLTQEQVILLGD